MVTWAEEEVNLAKKVHDVPIGDLGFKENGKIIETIPVVDLSNKEMTTLQYDPFLKGYPGDIMSGSSQKSQMFALLVTFQRMYKANQGLGFTIQTMLEWGTIRTGRLVKRIGDYLGGVQKKSESTPSPMQDKTSETP